MARGPGKDGSAQLLAVWHRASGRTAQGPLTSGFFIYLLFSYCNLMLGHFCIVFCRFDRILSLILIVNRRAGFIDDNII